MKKVCGERGRAASFSQKELKSLKENLIKSVRSKSLRFSKKALSSKSSDVQTISEGSECHLQGAGTLEESLLNAVSVLVEAGYLFKYKDTVWAPREEDDEEEDEEESSDASIALAYARRSTRRRARPTGDSLVRQASFQLSAEHHGEAADRSLKELRQESCCH